MRGSMGSMASQRRPRTLPDLVAHQGRVHGDRVAIRDGSTSVTYAGLADAAVEIAGELADRGVGPGDRVLLSGPNTVPWVLVAAGVVRSGATLVPCNHRLTATERCRAVEVTRPRLLVADPRDWPDEHAPVVAIDELVQLAARHRRCPLEPGPDEHATAAVMSTSGTTGAAKFVPMQHGPLLELYEALAPRLGLTPGDVVLGVPPLAHGFGLFGVLLDALVAGATVRLVPHYDSDTISDLVVADGVTALFVPFAVLHDLLEGGIAERPHHLRVGLTGGTDVPLSAFRAACARLGIARMYVGYGLTEAYGTVAFDEVNDASGETPPLTPLPGVEVRVVDPLGNLVGAGEDGEILVRGRSVMAGYLGDSLATPDLVDDGWLHTGDLGRLDPDGRLRVLTRIKDVVIVNGFNVVPAEVEAVLQAHPGLAAAAVVGVPEPRSGERLVACVVPAPGRTPSAESVLEHCRRHLAGYKVPARVLLMDRLPTSATGKRARTHLRQEVLRRLEGRPDDSPIGPAGVG